MEKKRLAALLEEMKSTAVEAGIGLAERFNSNELLEVEKKSNNVDLVSIADREAEDLIRARLNKAAPEIGFIGEESAPKDHPDSEFCWVVDPLDGTSNFLCGIPVWSVSVALCKQDLTPLAGVVHCPPLDKTWYAMRGGGAFVNGRQTYVRKKPPGGGVLNAVLATGFPYDIVNRERDLNVDNYGRMQLRFHKIRRFGSAAVDLALIAEGIFDGMWEMRLKAWDTAAGVVLVEEAGGMIRQYDGSRYKPGDSELIVAATPELLQSMLQILRKSSVDDIEHIYFDI